MIYLRDIPLPDYNEACDDEEESAIGFFLEPDGTVSTKERIVQKQDKSALILHMYAYCQKEIAEIQNRIF